MLIQTHIHEAEPPGYVAYLLAHQITGLARGCKFLMKRWQLPTLYESGVRFRLPPQHGTGFENFCTPLETYQRGWGDCDNLVIWRVAELWDQGESARCRCEWLGDAYHVLVRRGNGTLEDPSKILIERYGR